LVQGAPNYFVRWNVRVDGGLARWRSDSTQNYERHPFRVLIVTTSIERRNNIAERLLGLSPPILSQVCLSVLPDVIRNPLGPVWITPADLRDSLASSMFEGERSTVRHRYRRDVQRDRWITARITPRCLVPGSAEQKKGSSSS